MSHSQKLREWLLVARIDGVNMRIRCSRQSNNGGYFSDEQKGHFRSESRVNEAIQATTVSHAIFIDSQPLIRSFVFSSSQNQRTV